MDLKECLAALGGSYEAVMGRMMTEDRVKKFLRMFCADTSFSELCNAMETGDYEVAFRAAHTLKGVCANLELENLRERASEITEALRGNANNGADIILPSVIDEYRLAIEVIGNLE